MRAFWKKKKIVVRKHGAEYVERPKKETVSQENRPNVQLAPAEESAGRDWSRFRIIIGAVIFCVLWAVLWGRAWYLQVIAAPELAARAQDQHEFTEKVQGRRGMIMDRTGQVMARSVESHSIYAEPGKIKDKLAAANALGPILNLEPQKLYDRLSTTRQPFIWLKRKVDDMMASQVENLHLAGVGLQTEYTRVYPFKHMAGQLLGFVDIDGKGLEGLERSLNARLASAPMKTVMRRDARGKKAVSPRPARISG